MAHWRMASEGSMAGLGDFGGTCRRVGRVVKSGGGIEGDEARLTQSPVGADHGICQCETDGEKGIKMEHQTGRKRREWSKIRTAKRPRGPLPESQTWHGTGHGTWTWYWDQGGGGG